MPSTFSPNLRIELIGAGEQAGTWGTTTNTNLGTLIEDAISGVAEVTISSTAQALTALNGVADQARNATLKLNSASAAFAVYAPPEPKQYTVFNNTSYTATIYNSTSLGDTTAAGVGIAIPAGKTTGVWSDGTNFYVQTSLVLGNVTGTAENVTGTVAVANGGTGATTLTGVAIGNGTSAFTAKTNPDGAFVGTTDTQTLTNKTLISPVINDGYTEEVFTITDGLTVNLNPNNGSIQTWTLGANRTPGQASWAAGQSMTLMIDDGTARTINWTTLNVVWETNGGTAPLLATSGFTVIVLWKVGTTIYGARVGDA